MATPRRAVILDVDGTLMDTNYHHAVAWFRALRASAVTVPVWRLHRAIGMGGDRLVEHVAGAEVEEKYGDTVRDRWKREYERLIDEVVPLAGARELVVAVTERELLVVLASSGDPDHVEHYLDLLDVKGLAEAWTTAADADTSKPAPDLITTALDKVAVDEAVMIGDSVWDCAAAKRAGLPCVAVRTGGFAEAELRDSGAALVFDSLPEIRAALPELPFDKPTAR